MTKKVSLKKVLVEAPENSSRFGNRILKNIRDINPRIQVEDFIGERAQPEEGRLDVSDLGKETLHLLSFKGKFLKPCPGTLNYICCGYQILNVGTNCPMDCSYCILQSYFNKPNLRIFTNLEQELDHVFQYIDKHPRTMFRIGTGEFTDSLAIDHITHWTDMLLPGFSKRKNSILELKTKTDRIDRLLSLKQRDRIIVSWSLNSPYITAHEEHGAAGIKQRLKAAKQCQSEGFVLGFHFDPLIPHRAWKEGYLKTLELMDRYVDTKGIIWISLGAFRFIPSLKTIIRKRHPKTHILDGEFIHGLDGKLRYFRPIRTELYGFMRENLEKWHSDLGLYLCMESDIVWNAGMGWSPKNSKGLKRYLDNRVTKFFV